MSEQGGICSEDGTELFDRRIVPVLVDDRPQTCNQCHLYRMPRRLL
jgi:hypothetical protein